MIFDGFIFYNELELLEIRLHELDDVVDRFILVESNRTFSGKKKPLYFNDNRQRFSKFLHKIIYVMVGDMPETNNPWDREVYQRNYIAKAITHSAEDDCMIVSDVDEIPRASAIRNIGKLTQPLSIAMTSYSSFVNAKGGDWKYARIGPVRCFIEQTCEKIRHTHNYSVIENGGWHFSSLGGAKRIGEKMDAFSHQDEAVQRFNNRAYFEAFSKFGFDILGDRLDFNPVDDTYPRYLLDNLDGFKHFIAEVNLPYVPYLQRYALRPEKASAEELEWLYHVCVGYDTATYIGNQPEITLAMQRGLDRGCLNPEIAAVTEVDFLFIGSPDHILSALEYNKPLKLLAGQAYESGVKILSEHFKTIDRIGDFWAIVL